MAKLNQLILLENMMKTYDAMNIKDANLTHFQGVCTEKLVDKINGRLERLVVSKVRMSCRNVLLANYETMTKTTYWLGCRLFSDLPRAESRVLREKVEQMVELLNELVLKMVNVDEEYAKRFFERIKRAYRKRKITDFELWKAQQSHLTIKKLKVYQADLTADILIMGILKYDEDTRENILDRRLRIDCTTLSPDFITSGARQFDASNTGVSKYGSGFKDPKNFTSYNSEYTLSGLPSFAEGAYYWMQWAGADTTLLNLHEGDYTADFGERVSQACQLHGLRENLIEFLVILHLTGDQHVGAAYDAVDFV